VELQIRLYEPIGVLAARYAGIRAALEEARIDYWCAGDRTIAEAASDAGIDAVSLRERLEQAETDDLRIDWQGTSMRDLVTHLEHEHHQLLRSIVFHAAVVLNSAATADADCTEPMRRTFRQLSSDLILHIEKEEHIFFPLLLSLDEARAKGLRSPAAPGEVRRNIDGFVRQHEAIGGALAQLRRDSAAVEPAGNEICRQLLRDLDVLERQVHEYLNLENYVVFPRAIALEDDLRTASPALTATPEKGGTS